MRTLAIVIATVLGTGVAVAEEPARPATQAKAPSVIDLQLGRVLSAEPDTADERPVDLFPADVLGDGSLSMDTTGRSGELEKRAGVSWDGGWKTHVAQIGVMAVGFAALAGLCSGGGCMIPKGVDKVLPDWARAHEPVVPYDRPPPKEARSAY